MAAAILLPEAVYPADIYPIPSRNIQNNINSIELSLSRIAWPDTGGDLLIAELEISTDNGATWAPFFRFTVAGGVVLKVDGSVLTKSSMLVNMPAGTGRRVRGAVILAAAITTSVTLITT